MNDPYFRPRQPVDPGALTINEYESLCVLRLVREGRCAAEALAQRLRLSRGHSAAVDKFCKRLASGGYLTESPEGFSLSPLGLAAVARGRLSA